MYKMYNEGIAVSSLLSSSVAKILIRIKQEAIELTENEEMG
jgi:hypothetical protein